MTVKRWGFGLCLALLAFQIQAGGSLTLVEGMKVIPVTKDDGIDNLTIRIFSDKFGEAIWLSAQHFKSDRKLSLPISAAEDLHQALQKAQRWGDIARKHKTEMTKPLACIGDDPTGDCNEAGVSVQSNQIGMLFDAQEEGNVNFLIVSFRSGPEQVRSVFALDEKNLDYLVLQVATWQQGLEKLRKQRSKEALFE
ncbi:hypothetical protein [Microbulbifer sp. JMSA003]|uniref:hypothetical protein n=1 Tax=Microbulbifer sp. JMSA003 TaxID=3243369 RepID=UPI00403A1AB9